MNADLIPSTASLILARVPSRAKSTHAPQPTTHASAHNTSTCSHATTTAPTIPVLPSFSNSVSFTAMMPAFMAPPPLSERLQLQPLPPQPQPPTLSPLLRLVSLLAPGLAALQTLAPPAPQTVLILRVLVVSSLWPLLVLSLCCKEFLWMRGKGHSHTQPARHFLGQRGVGCAFRNSTCLLGHPAS